MYLLVSSISGIFFYPANLSAKGQLSQSDVTEQVMISIAKASLVDQLLKIATVVHFVLKF